ncbi:hypothetical protein L1887_14105 [Cichorium endivia]|nr:hypothetical protein L1887_14105 [Cichorium endivia]
MDSPGGFQPESIPSRAEDNITTGESVTDGPNYLESLGKKFQMGFFPHEKTSEVRRYVGIWYTMDPKTVVWVANRDKPVRDSTGIFTVTEDGCAKLLDGNQAEHFSTETAKAISGLAFRLLSNTTIQTRKVLTNKTWYYQDYSVIEPYSRLVMSHTGNIQFFSWPQGKTQWVMDWQEPKDKCSVFRVCGSFGICSKNNDSLCSCLDGFEPTSPNDYTAGCKRTSPCLSGTSDTFLKKTMISMDDTSLPFYKSENETACMEKCLEKCQCVAYSYINSQNMSGIVDESRNVAEKGCWFWNSEPDNLRANGAHNISFRVSKLLKGPTISPASGEPEPGEKSSSINRVLVIVIVVSVVVLLSLCGIIYIFYKRLRNRRENNHNTEFQSNDTQRRIKELLDLDYSNEDEREGIDVPYFELESIIAATDGLSEKNMLGQGGFGPVYKGKLPGGQEIAVKRLSSLSGQGLQEFKNEVMLIAKLQHRNLVRLLGYCIRGEEQILLYEYMPNRSLDTFIFDRTLCTSLDWKMRFDIIMGIARGLNYLHYDSRLRVIHRDLKTSNILLDEDMNPKISDFGLAKIVKGKDLEAITNRVIGTFGYMSPEYALDGLFSVKSDVFSFGVVMLEIVSGKKNTGFYQSQRTLSLLGHAWNLWIENKPLELMDEILMESCNSSEVLKCINIGLLCVQGEPDDRPTMTKVVLMLGGDIVTLPTPKEPAFIARKDNVVSSSSSSSRTDTKSKNMLTITKLDGR